MEENKSYCIVPADVANEEKHMLFRIPLYQRLFAWSPNEVNQLMEDLKNHFKKHEKDSKKYYLGMLTVVKQDGRLDLIDGQQRMTVLSLLSIGFMRALEHVDKAVSDKWKKVLCDESGKPRLFFNGRSDDYTYLQALSKGEKTTYVNQKMSDGLETISDFLTENFKDDTKQLIKFANQVYDRMAYFITELPEHYVENPSSLNEYFEAMNSSGKALEQHEILKVALLQDQPDSKKIAFTKLWNRISNFSMPLRPKVEGRKDPSQNIGVERQNNLYKEYIKACRNENYDWLIDELCVSAENEAAQSIASIGIEKKEDNNADRFDKEDAILSFAKFLLIVLAIHNGDDAIARQNTSKLLQTFKENPPKDLEKFYHQLLQYRLILDMYVVRIENTAGGGVHTLIARNEENEELPRANERVRQYQAMLDVSTELHIWLLPLLKSLAEKNLTQSEILRNLIETDKQNSHQTCPGLDELVFSNRNRSRYWFWRLDYAIWEKQLLAKEDEDVFAEIGFGEKAVDKQAILEYEFRENRSIEHLHPQDETKQPDKWEWDEINRFGNLAMISSSFNSEQRNWLVDSKLENIKPQVDNKSLQSLKLYFMYLQAKKDGGWKQGENGSMQTHERNIYKLLEESMLQYEDGQQ